MTAAALELLRKAARQTVTSGVNSPEWAQVRELQKLRMVSVKPITKYVANIELTDLGRAELARVQK